MDSDFLLIGRVGKPHGLRGQFKVHGGDSFHESFFPGLRVYLCRGQEVKEWVLSECKVQAHSLLCRFEGLDDRDQAQELYGYFLYLHEKDLKPLPEGEYYGHQLIGNRVYSDRGLYLGIMEGIFSTAAHDVWVIKDGEKEKLFPAVDDFILSVDDSRKEIRVRDLYDPSEGNDR